MHLCLYPAFLHNTAALSHGKQPPDTAGNKEGGVQLESPENYKVEEKGKEEGHKENPEEDKKELNTHLVHNKMELKEWMRE